MRTKFIIIIILLLNCFVIAAALAGNQTADSDSERRRQNLHHQFPYSAVSGDGLCMREAAAGYMIFCRNLDMTLF